jgi:hypothetical protein
MSCLNKLLFAALIAFPLLFASDATDDELQNEARKSVKSISCCDFLMPNIEYWLFGDTSFPEATKIQWSSSSLEKFSFGQLMSLVKDGEVRSENLLLIPFMQLFCQKAKTD